MDVEPLTIKEILLMIDEKLGRLVEIFETDPAEEEIPEEEE